MQLSDFKYHLPEELIAHYPAEKRSQSRLLCLDTVTGDVRHRIFSDFVDLLQADDLLVFNDTRVIPARLFGRKESGGKVEVLVERITQGNRMLAQIRASKSPKSGTVICFDQSQTDTKNDDSNTTATVLGREGEFYVLQFPAEVNLSEVLQHVGHIPLPPYIKRSDTVADAERYQTVYAKEEGAVAAPTAGLHFDKDLLASIRGKGIDSTFLTLHIGAGTFQPVRVDNILDHEMHKELIMVPGSVCAKVNDCKERGGRVIAIGTTTVRSLESAAVGYMLKPFCGDTDIFIYPGYDFKIVDAMITNFHLPESTLLMLVSAFSDKKMLLDAYQNAIEHKYRFYSYGDAMFLFNNR